jgi:hypothetical protein
MGWPRSSALAMSWSLFPTRRLTSPPPSENRHWYYYRGTRRSGTGTLIRQIPLGTPAPFCCGKTLPVTGLGRLRRPQKSSMALQAAPSKAKISEYGKAISATRQSIAEV